MKRFWLELSKKQAPGRTDKATQRCNAPVSSLRQLAGHLDGARVLPRLCKVATSGTEEFVWSDLDNQGRVPSSTPDSGPRAICVPAILAYRS